MSKKELNRKTILEKVLCKKLTLKNAAKIMQVCYRQAGRIKKRYIAGSDSGLIHKNRGRLPSNSYSEKYKGKIIKLYKKNIWVLVLL